MIDRLITCRAAIATMVLLSVAAFAQEEAPGNPLDPPHPVCVTLRLHNALVGGRAHPWQREVRVSFWLTGERAMRGRIGPKVGWNIAGWSGRVERLEAVLDRDRFTAAVEARISSNEVDSGRYTFRLDGAVTGDSVQGTFTTTHGDRTGPAQAFQGTLAAASFEQVNPDDAVYTIRLIEALPRGEVLTVYLDRQNGGFPAAFAFAPTYSRRPFEIDASRLSVEDTRVRGAIRVFRSKMGELQEGGSEGLSEYRIEATIQDGGAVGTFEGVNPESKPVTGPVWGQVDGRPSIPDPARVFLKLEDGFTGGAYWQNRVFFHFDLRNGRADAGKADNNKNVFTARCDNARLDLRGTTVQGTLQATVLGSPAVDKGPYTFDLQGFNVGGVLSGRFTTTRDGRPVKRGYFVGGIEALEP